MCFKCGKLINFIKPLIVCAGLHAAKQMYEKPNPSTVQISTENATAVSVTDLTSY